MSRYLTRADKRPVRKEIRTRLADGESRQAIYRDLLDRFDEPYTLARMVTDASLPAATSKLAYRVLLALVTLGALMVSAGYVAEAIANPITAIYPGRVAGLGLWLVCMAGVWIRSRSAFLIVPALALLGMATSPDGPSFAINLLVGIATTFVAYWAHNQLFPGLPFLFKRNGSPEKLLEPSATPDAIKAAPLDQQAHSRNTRPTDLAAPGRSSLV